MRRNQGLSVGIVTPGLSSSEQDWCILALLDLVRALALEDRITVFPLRYPHHDRPYSVFGARVFPLGGAETRGLSRLGLFARGLRSIVAEHRRQRFDVLHGMWAHEPGFLGTVAGRRLGIGTVVSLLGGEMVDLGDIDYGGQRSLANRWLIRLALLWADWVVTSSHYLRQQAARRVSDERLVTLPLGVDTAFFRSEEFPDHGIVLRGDPRLIHVASLPGQGSGDPAAGVFPGRGRDREGGASYRRRRRPSTRARSADRRARNRSTGRVPRRTAVGDPARDLSPGGPPPARFALGEQPHGGPRGSSLRLSHGRHRRRTAAGARRRLPDRRGRGSRSARAGRDRPAAPAGDPRRSRAPQPGAGDGSILPHGDDRPASPTLPRDLFPTPRDEPRPGQWKHARRSLRGPGRPV